MIVYGNKNKSHPLYDAMRDKIHNFEIIMIERYDSAVNALNGEKQWIRYFNTQNRDFGYNIGSGGTASNLGLKFSQIQKSKISKSQPACKPVVIDGKFYYSISIAAKEIKSKRTTIRARVRNKNFPNYRYATEKEIERYGEVNKKRKIKPRNIPVVIDNIYYSSQTQASKKLKIKFSTLIQRIRLTSKNFTNYRYATPEEIEYNRSLNNNKEKE